MRFISLLKQSLKHRAYRGVIGKNLELYQGTFLLEGSGIVILPSEFWKPISVAIVGIIELRIKEDLFCFGFLMS